MSVNVIVLSACVCEVFAFKSNQVFNKFTVGYLVVEVSIVVFSLFALFSAVYHKALCFQLKVFQSVEVKYQELVVSACFTCIVEPLHITALVHQVIVKTDEVVSVKFHFVSVFSFQLKREFVSVSV
jgi:hypothetical protein